MLATGVRSPLGIEVFGDDLEAIERTAISVEHAVAKVPGTRSAFAERSTGGFYIDFEVNREAAARHGLSVEDINMVVAQSIGGENVSEVVAGRARYPINVRYAREYRDDPPCSVERSSARRRGGRFHSRRSPRSRACSDRR